MIKIYKYDELGGMNGSWLTTKYHFSFSRYYNPERMGFGTLRVINDDIIKAKTGFEPHSHQNMEIITYVRKGAITHKDSEGNEGRTETGDVQVMSAGSGITHSEHNLENEDTILYQIWIHPHTKNVKPRWDSAQFPKTLCTKELPLLVSGREEDKEKNVLYIHQDAAIFGGKIAKGTTVIHPIKHQAYILVPEGKVTIENQTISQGDGCEITESKSVSIYANDESEILIIDVPVKI